MLEDEVNQYLRIFVAFGDKFINEFISNHNKFAEDFLVNFIEITSLDDFDISEEISNFWHNFMSKLYSKDANNDKDNTKL